jgi:biopolymer transport protein ExbD
LEDDVIKTSSYEGPDRRKANRQEFHGSKLTLQFRSGRAHSTESFADNDAITEINVTPLVDVALVLVIIFMVVSPFILQAGIVVSESKAGAATGKASLDQNVQISLSAEGQIKVNDKITPLEDLSLALKEAIAKSKDGLVTLQAETKNRVGQVVQILDLAKQSGAKKVAILNKIEATEKTAAAAK